MTVRCMGCLQGQDVTQEAVTGVTTETNVHTTALMFSYVSNQATSHSRPSATWAHSSVAVTVQPAEPPGASQSSGTGSSTSLAPPGGITGTNTPHTLATTLKAGSPAVCGFFGPLLLPVLLLTCCVHNWMSNINSASDFQNYFFSKSLKGFFALTSLSTDVYIYTDKP